MNDPRNCPKCGGTLPANAPSGVCPKCLLMAGLAADSSSEKSDPSGQVFAVTTPQPPGGFNPPAPSVLAALFPQLEILQVLGHGGMGAVYKARQSKLDRIVALKIIRPETADDPAFAERFNREARTLARLNHPHIVAVHDFGEVQLADSAAGGAPRPLYYFVMEYVDGANLRQLMEAGTVTPNQALAIIPQICEALQFAHDEGIVHRDIKPENVLIDSRGRVKIADFGLAKLAARTPGDFTLTATHQVMGTPRYMAPEQMTGSHHVDHRADIYSLGVVFYELLTGEVPMGQFDPPSKRAPVDARLDGIVLRALAREPDRRFQRASEMKSSVEVISSASVNQPTIVPQAYPPRGASTIIEREVAAAWRWMVGQPAAAASEPAQFPTLLAIALAVAGCLMFLLPWMDVTIPESGSAASDVAPVALAEHSRPSFTRLASYQSSNDAAVIQTALYDWPPPVAAITPLLAQEGAAWPSDYARSFGLSETIQITPGQATTLQGWQVWPGLVASVLMACIAVLIWMLPPRLWHRSAWNFLVVILSGTALACTIVYPMQVENISVSFPVPPVEAPATQAPVATSTVSNSPGSDETVRLVQAAAEGYATGSFAGDQPLSVYQHVIGYREGFYGSLAISAALLLLGATGVRRSIAAGPEEQATAARSTPVQRSPESARLAMLALGIGGALLTLAPWFQVQITDPDVIAAMDVTQLEIVNGRTAHVVDFTGIDLFTGKIAAVLLAAAGLVQIIVPQRERANFVTAILTAVMALAAAAMVFIAREEVDEKQVYLNMTGVVDINVVGGLRQIGTGWQWISHMQHETEINSLYYACIAASVMLLVLSAAALRDSLSGEGEDSPALAQHGAPLARVRFSVPQQEQLGRQVIAHFESYGYRLEQHADDRWVFKRGKPNAGLYVVDIRKYGTTLTVRATPAQPGYVWVSCLWEVRTMASPIYQKHIAVLEAEGYELETILNESAPPPPMPSGLTIPDASSIRDSGAVVTPVAASVAYSTPPSVAIDSKTGEPVDLDEAYAEVDGPSLAMIVVGLLMIIGHLVTLVILLNNPYEDETAWLAIPGAFTGLGMVIGGLNLRGLRSRGWSQLGIIAGCIPTSPGWLLCCPVSVWAMKNLSQPAIRAAFMQRKRQRVQLREGIAPPTGPVDLEAVRSEVDGPSLTMVVMGLFIAIAHLVALIVASGMPTIAGDESVLVLMGLGIVPGLMMFIGGLNLRGLRSRGWAQVGIISGFIPTPGLVVALPISLWCLAVFNRPHMPQAFLQSRRERMLQVTDVAAQFTAPASTMNLDTVRAEVDGPSLAMIVVGLMIAIGHTVAIIHAAGMPNNDLTVGVGALGIVTGLGMFIGGLNLRTLRSGGWAQLGIISGFIPSGPGLVLAIPISAWSLGVMRRPHMAQAFLQRQRERSGDTGLPVTARYSRKAIVAAFWAGLFVLLAIPSLIISSVQVNGPDSAMRAGPTALLLIVALPVLLAPIGTTVLGGMAISDIKRSQGRIMGIGLAVVDLLAFPLLILYGAIFAAFMYFNTAGLNMNLGLSVFISLGSTTALGTAIAAPIVKSVWQRATAASESASAP